MNVRKKLRKSNWIYFWVVSILLTTKIAYTQGISTDGTIGAAQTLTGANVSIPQTLGKTAGNNLFHSFADFNIDKGQTVIFTGADNLQNVISRVTGDNKSIIDGTLKSDIKNADFYFINPNGITFNANASVDLPAAFHVTTADKMDFDKNGGVFYADLSKKSQLSSDSPAALGFLGTSKVNNGLIDFNAAQITLNKTQTMDLVAGNISVENHARPKSEAGEVRLVAMQGEGTASLVKTVDGVLPLPDKIPLSNNAGNISIDDGIDTSGNGAGRVSVWGEKIITGVIDANNNGDINATQTKGVYIIADAIKMADYEHINSNTSNNGNAGNITINTNSLDLGEYSSISSSVISHSDNDTEGNAGNIYITSDAIRVINSSILSDTNFHGNAGMITIQTKKLDVLGGGNISSSSGLNYGMRGTEESGNAGNVKITADDIRIGGENRTYTNGTVHYSRIQSDTASNGNAGDVSVKTKNLEINQGGQISSSTLGFNGSSNQKNYLVLYTLFADEKFNDLEDMVINTGKGGQYQ